MQFNVMPWTSLGVDAVNRAADEIFTSLVYCFYYRTVVVYDYCFISHFVHPLNLNTVYGCILQIHADSRGLITTMQCLRVCLVTNSTVCKPYKMLLSGSSRAPESLIM